MLIGVVIGLAGLAIVGIAYVNRDNLSDEPLAIKLAPYIVGAAFFIAIGIVVIVLTTNQTDIWPARAARSLHR